MAGDTEIIYASFDGGDFKNKKNETKAEEATYSAKQLQKLSLESS